MAKLGDAHLAILGQPRKRLPLVRKKAGFTHNMSNFGHDVRGKRFNTHGELHCKEMTISKDHVTEKPRRGWRLWRHGRP